MIRSASTLLTFLCACGAPNAVAEPTAEPAGNVAATPEPSESTDAPMVITAFSLQAEGTTIEVSADGTVTVGGQANGQLLPNGSFVNDGEVFMSLSGDTLTASGHEVGSMSADGTANVEGVVLRYDQSGRLQANAGGDGDGPVFVLTPADTPARRAAMLLTLVLAL